MNRLAVARLPPTQPASETASHGRWLAVALATLLLFAIPVHCLCGHMIGDSRTWATAVDGGVADSTDAAGILPTAGMHRMSGGERSVAPASLTSAESVAVRIPTVLTAPDDEMAAGTVAVPGVLAELWLLLASVLVPPVMWPESPIRRREPAPPTPPPRTAWSIWRNAPFPLDDNDPATRKEPSPMTRLMNLPRAFRLTTLLAVALLLAAGLGLTASAHEHRDVAKKYTFVVGFLNEPAYAGQQNGMDLRIATIDPTGGVNSQPVEGAEKSLTAEVIYGDQTMPLTLEPVYNEKGSYRGIFFPTVPGDYAFHITGTLDGTSIDETFRSSDGKFGPVEDPAPLMFPQVNAAGTPEAATPTA